MRSNLHSKFGRDVEMRVISFLRLPNRFGNLWQGEEFCKIHGARGKAVLTLVDSGRSAMGVFVTNVSMVGLMAE